MIILKSGDREDSKSRYSTQHLDLLDIRQHITKQTPTTPPKAFCLVGPLRGRSSESRCLMTSVSNWKRSKGRCLAHTLRFLGHQAAYYETDAGDATHGFFAWWAVERQAQRIEIFTELCQQLELLKRQLFKTHTSIRWFSGSILRNRRPRRLAMLFIWWDHWQAGKQSESKNFGQTLYSRRM